jgi:hypothetical protein
VGRQLLHWIARRPPATAPPYASVLLRGLSSIALSISFHGSRLAPSAGREPRPYPGGPTTKARPPPSSSCRFIARRLLLRRRRREDATQEFRDGGLRVRGVAPLVFNLRGQLGKLRRRQLARQNLSVAVGVGRVSPRAEHEDASAHLSPLRPVPARGVVRQRLEDRRYLGHTAYRTGRMPASNPPRGVARSRSAYSSVPSKSSRPRSAPCSLNRRAITGYALIFSGLGESSHAGRERTSPAANVRPSSAPPRHP